MISTHVVGSLPSGMCHNVPHELVWSPGRREVSFDGLCAVFFAGLRVCMCVAVYFSVCVHPWCLSEWTVFGDTGILRAANSNIWRCIGFVMNIYLFSI